MNDLSGALAILDTERGTAGEHAYERIRADIVFGRLVPGQRLRLEALRSDYGVSIPTLREILSRLVPEALVVAEGQRGFQVAPCSAVDLKDIAALRMLLEAHALALSFAAGDMEWEGRIVAAHHKLARMEDDLLAGARADTGPWKRYDREFHQALVSACSSRPLLDLHAGVYDRYLRYQMVFVIFRGQVAADEHKALLGAALKRDVVTATDILRAHISACVDFALAKGLVG